MLFAWYSFCMTNSVCPQCAVPMQSVTTTGHYGRRFVVDQCRQCGGIWFDRYEHHRVSDDEVAVIDVLNVDELVTSKQVQKTLHCPVDGSELYVFNDPQYPKDIVLEACGRCGGMWFNRGEFASYRSYFTARWPKKRVLSDSAALISKVYLSLNKQRAQSMHTKRMYKETVLEMLRSLVTFLVTKPVGAVSSAMLHIVPLYVLVRTMLDPYEEYDMHLDRTELVSLITEVQQSRGVTHVHDANV